MQSGSDDYDVDYLSEEEETQQLGGEGFTPQQLAEAEKRFQDQLVSLFESFGGSRSTNTTPCTITQNLDYFGDSEIARKEMCPVGLASWEAQGGEKGVCFCVIRSPCQVATRRVWQSEVVNRVIRKRLLRSMCCLCTPPSPDQHRTGCSQLCPQATASSWLLQTWQRHLSPFQVGPNSTRTEPFF
jgi:hypothetical protein